MTDPHLESPLEPPEGAAVNAVTARVSGYNIAARVTTAVTMTGGRHMFAILAGVVIARGLGPVSFGYFMFLLAGFTTLHTLLDLSTSQGFFTFVCKRAWSIRLYAAYGAWVALQFLVPLAVIGLVFPDTWIGSVWRGQSRETVLLAFAASYAQRVFWQLVIQTYEAQRLTIRVQLATVSIMAAHFALALVLRYLHVMTPAILFTAIALEFSVVGSVMLTLLGRRQSGALDTPPLRQMAGEMLAFILPLAPSLLLQSLNSFSETWLLQIYGGPIQQAFFSVAQQYANIGLIFSFSATNVFWKELAAAQERGDRDGMRRIYVSSTRALFLASGGMVAFAIFWSDVLIRMILGPGYAPAAPVFAVTLFTSVSQCFGIIPSIIYLATGRTRTWSVFQGAYVVVGLPLSFVILWLFKLGALGLALKLAFMSTASILFYDYYISRLEGWKTDNLFRLGLGAFLFGAGFVARTAINAIGPGWPAIIQLAAGLTIYGLIVLPCLGYGGYRLGYGVYLRKFRDKLA